MERKGAEVYVGLFLLIGLSVIAAMVVTFGKAKGTWNAGDKL